MNLFYILAFIRDGFPYAVLIFYLPTSGRRRRNTWRGYPILCSPFDETTIPFLCPTPSSASSACIYSCLHSSSCSASSCFAHIFSYFTTCFEIPRCWRKSLEGGIGISIGTFLVFFLNNYFCFGCVVGEKSGRYLDRQNTPVCQLAKKTRTGDEEERRKGAFVQVHVVGGLNERTYKNKLVPDYVCDVMHWNTNELIKKYSLCISLGTRQCIRLMSCKTFLLFHRAIQSGQDNWWVCSVMGSIAWGTVDCRVWLYSWRVYAFYSAA